MPAQRVEPYDDSRTGFWTPAFHQVAPERSTPGSGRPSRNPPFAEQPSNGRSTTATIGLQTPPSFPADNASSALGAVVSYAERRPTIWLSDGFTPDAVTRASSPQKRAIRTNDHAKRRCQPHKQNRLSRD